MKQVSEAFRLLVHELGFKKIENFPVCVETKKKILRWLLDHESVWVQRDTELDLSLVHIEGVLGGIKILEDEFGSDTTHYRRKLREMLKKQEMVLKAQMLASPFEEEEKEANLDEALTRTQKQLSMLI